VCGYAQNLVPNPSFEDTVNCPPGWASINSINNWYSPNGSSPDLFYTCASPFDVGVPQNGAGFQSAKNGNGYIGVGSSFDSTNLNYREYIQVELTDTLVANKEYILSFFISKADSAPIVVTKMGAYLSNGPISTSGGLSLNVVPQVESSTGVYLTDTANWLEVKDTIIAAGGEKFITIGYFFDNANADTLTVQQSLYFYRQSYYYIDDVSLTELIPNSINELNSLNSSISLYPNPTKDSFCISSIKEIETVELLKMDGSHIKSYKAEKQYNTSDLDQGVYLVKITLRNKTHIYKKLIT
jgi:hypothetical protein